MLTQNHAADEYRICTTCIVKSNVMSDVRFKVTSRAIKLWGHNSWMNADGKRNFSYFISGMIAIVKTINITPTTTIQAKWKIWGKSNHLCNLLALFFIFFSWIRRSIIVLGIILPCSTQKKHTAGRPVNFHQLYYIIYILIFFLSAHAHILCFFSIYIAMSACINGCRRHYTMFMHSVSYSILRIFPL